MAGWKRFETMLNSPVTGCIELSEAKKSTHMTTVKTYRCNLCRDRIDGETGVGVQFESSSSLSCVLVSSAENHICGSCLQELRSEKFANLTNSTTKPSTL